MKNNTAAIGTITSAKGEWHFHETFTGIKTIDGCRVLPSFFSYGLSTRQMYSS